MKPRQHCNPVIGDLESTSSSYRLLLRQQRKQRRVRTWSKNIDDKLSRLPEEILSHILSLMPTNFAVRTSILSKRWRYTWTLVTNLDIDDIHGKKILSTSVDRVMELCKSSQIQLFRLHVSKACYEKSIVSNWIDNAVRLNVRELDIQVIKLEVPLSMFTCKTLTKLRLYRGYYDQDVWELPCSVNLPCLKTLDITSMSNPNVNIFKLIRGCPMLESLSLEAKWREVEEDYIFNIPTLKRLKLTMERSLRTNQVVLNVPNLEYLFVGGSLCSFFIMENVSSLVEASVSLNGQRLDHLWAELLKGLIGVKSFSAQNVPFLNSRIPTISLPVFPNMTNLELKDFWETRLITQFLGSSPQLKHLCIENADEIFYKPEESSWIEPKLVPTCMLTSLTTIKISICKGLKCYIKFVEYMLGNAEVLKTVTITWKKLCIDEQMQLGAQVLNFPRASSCEIHFHGNCSQSTSS